jgi:hypothetical protein
VENGNKVITAMIVEDLRDLREALAMPSITHPVFRATASELEAVAKALKNRIV